MFSLSLRTKYSFLVVEKKKKRNGKVSMCATNITWPMTLSSPERRMLSCLRLCEFDLEVQCVATILHLLSLTCPPPVHTQLSLPRFEQTNKQRLQHQFALLLCLSMLMDARKKEARWVDKKGLLSLSLSPLSPLSVCLSLSLWPPPGPRVPPREKPRTACRETRSTQAQQKKK